MSEYKLYCLDRNGRITRRVDLEANDDAQAIAAARDLKHPAECELWSGTRKVAVIPPAGSPASA